MAVLTYSELQNLMLDRAQANTSTDTPIGATAIARFLNEAYADMWEISGGSIKKVTSATAWTTAQSAVGIVVGLLTDVNEVMALFATTTAPQTITCGTTINQPAVTSAVLFANVLPGMAVSGTEAPSGSYVLTKTDSSNLTMSENASATNASASLTFSSVGQSGEYVLQRVERSYIEHLRQSSRTGTYGIPKVYSLTRLATTTAANVGKLQLDYWPGTTGYYFPMHYQPQFTPIDSTTVTTPDLNDIESRDLGLLAALKLAQQNDRFDLVPGIVADLSSRTAEVMERKLAALMSADQDK